MRTSTKNIVSALGLGTLAMSYVIGMNSTTASGFSASGLSGGPIATPGATEASPDPSTSAAASASPQATDASTAKPSAAPSTSSTKKSGSTSSGGSSSSSGGSGSSSSGSSSSGSSSSGSSSVTKTGGAIQYQFGVVQVAVTKTDGKIASIELVQASATHGRQSAFSPLVQAAIGAQGSSFGNLSGATYTTDAFKQALDSALGKF
ncbi:MAG: hypothetical protein RL670_443 [Actinomycetota bacterium]